MARPFFCAGRVQYPLMRTLYPAIDPYVRHTLSVDPPHRVYVEECGNPGGIPVLFVHGGPGGGCEPYHRQFFDPDRYRIILFDQRGCGRSTPHASLDGNNTQALLSDIETIREHLNVERWLIFGGSWGSTLGLLYAESFPQRVVGLVLRGIFLCRSRDVSWFYQNGASRLFPDYWKEFISQIQPDRRDNLVSAYYQLLTGADEVKRLSAARAWSIWEGRTSTLESRAALVNRFGDSHIALSMARIECHYFVHNAFIQENQILDQAKHLKGIPGVIVHGRYDVVCPVDQAWLLHQHWSDSRLVIVPGSGHSTSEPAMVDPLIRATDHFAETLG